LTRNEGCRRGVPRASPQDHLKGAQVYESALGMNTGGEPNPLETEEERVSRVPMERSVWDTDLRKVLSSNHRIRLRSRARIAL